MFPPPQLTCDLEMHSERSLSENKHYVPVVVHHLGSGKKGISPAGVAAFIHHKSGGSVASLGQVCAMASRNVKRRRT